MKNHILIALILILVGLFLLNKIRIIVFASFWNVFLIIAVVLLGFFLLSGPMRRFIEKYDRP